MSKPIEVGKWAAVYKRTSCCGAMYPQHGVPFVVSRIALADHLVRCDCGFSYPAGTLWVGGIRDEDEAVPIYVVKRIDGPDESTDTETTRELEQQ